MATSHSSEMGFPQEELYRPLPLYQPFTYNSYLNAVKVHYQQAYIKVVWPCWT